MAQQPVNRVYDDPASRQGAKATEFPAGSTNVPPKNNDNQWAVDALTGLARWLLYSLLFSLLLLHDAGFPGCIFLGLIAGHFAAVFNKLLNK